MRRSLAILALLSLAAGCGSARSAAGGGGDADGHIDGRVLAAPGCPVERADSPCPPRPLSGAIVVATESSADARVRTRTSSDGTFSMQVRPGNYRVIATVKGLGGLDSAIVAVEPGATAQVQLVVDSGLR